MRASFETAGDVRSVDLLAACVTVWREARSGSIRFTRAGSSAGFDFADGELTDAYSSDPRFETAAILVRAGKLEATSLERLTVPPGTDSALAALQAGILTRREWKWGEKIRSIEILAELLGWPDGKYLFDSDAKPVRGEYTLAIPRLILELFLRSRDHHLVDHQLGPADMPLVRSEKFEDEFATFGLTADAESVVHLIDGRASASEICAKAPAEEFAVLKLLAALRTLGLIRQDAAESSAPEIEVADSVMESHETAPARTSAASEIENISDLSEPSDFGSKGDDEFATRVSPREDFPSDDISEASPIRELHDTGLDRDVSETAPGWESEPAERQWEAPSDDLERELDSTIEPPASPPGGGRSWGRALGILLALLVLAVAGIVFVQSRRGPSQPLAAQNRTQPRSTPPTPAVPTPVFSSLPSTPPPSPRAAPPPTRISSPTATARPSKAKPTPAPVHAAPARVEPGRAQWLERSRNDRRKLDQDRRTRYAIQLELACEEPSLVEAWKHDQPAGSMWLLTVPHQGHECFRVLWGRFPTLEAARKAKAGAPAFFSTPNNHPAVVSVR